MHLFKTTAVAAAMAIFALASGTASAQSATGPGYYAAPPPQHGQAFLDRRGLTLGFGFGLGNMSADSGPIECIDCAYSPGAAAANFHIGGMLNPRLALLFEIWGTVKALDHGGYNTLQQTMALFAAQYWISPQLWIKGGIGAAHLDINYDDGLYVISEPVADGGAIMGAVGYEVLASPRFSVDIQLRLGTGSYQGLNDQIHAGDIGVGFNWY